MSKRLVVLFLFVLLATGAWAQTAASSSKPFVVEYYYKVKWGHQQEFLDLFKKNHYPLLKKQIEMGRMTSVTVTAPRYHMSEDARWDYRVTIVFKNTEAAFGEFDEQALIRQLYPDQATYKQEEQRRFEILDQHTDVPIVPVDMDSRP
jgi:hypothetical protein